MREFRLRQDLERHKLGSYALPLGVEPNGLPEPMQGYTLTYQSGENEDEPDFYLFHVVVSHERVKEVVDAAFALLPQEVTPVLEIGSRDAYRSVDVYVAEEPVPLDDFLRTWYEFEEILLEDVCLGCGANSDDPWVEVFVDSWKGVALHVPIEWRERVEKLMHDLKLEEVPETWPDGLDKDPEVSRPREVLSTEEDESPDIDELLLELCARWGLALNVDPDTNIDEGGRELGQTLWHAIVLAEPSEPDGSGADITFWATAGSIGELEDLVAAWFESHREWALRNVLAMDRVAFDERPDDLASLPYKRTSAQVHRVEIERWQTTISPDDDSDDAERS